APSGTGTPPASATRPARSTPLESGIRPGPGSVPGGHSSSPVARTPTRGREWTRSSPWPAETAADRWWAASSVPAASTAPPGSTSSPRPRTCRPAATGSRTRTRAGRSVAPGGWSVGSPGTAASAPSGSGAPVMIGAAVPALAGGGCAVPAGASPTAGRATGASAVAPATSSARTANPSIAEFANGGTARTAVRSSARRRPCASVTGTRRGSSGSTRPSTDSWYSSTVITRVLSVDRQARVDLRHPRPDAALEVRDVGVARVAQESLRLGRPPPGEAVDDDGGARLGADLPGGERVGDEPLELHGARAGDRDAGPLGGLPHVEADDVVLP